MHVKDIYGNYVKRPGVLADRAMRRTVCMPNAYSAILRFLPGTHRLVVPSDEGPECLADAGYTWLMLLPMDTHWCMTTMFDEKRQALEWYYDITNGNFIDTKGIPCFDDLYLDIVLEPDRSIILLDENELHEAEQQGKIAKEDAAFAYAEYRALEGSQWADPAFLGSFCELLLAEYEE